MIEDVRRYVPIAHPDLLKIVKEGMLQRGWIYIRDVDINIKPLTNISTHAFGLMTLDEWIEHRRTMCLAATGEGSMPENSVPPIGR